MGQQKPSQSSELPAGLLSVTAVKMGKSYKEPLWGTGILQCLLMETRKVVLAERAEKGHQQVRENMEGFQRCPLNSHLGLSAVRPVINEDVKATQNTPRIRQEIFH